MNTDFGPPHLRTTKSIFDNALSELVARVVYHRVPRAVDLCNYLGVHNGPCESTCVCRVSIQ